MQHNAPPDNQRDAKVAGSSDEPLVPEIVSTGEYDPFIAGSAPPEEPAPYWAGGQVLGGGRVRVYSCSRSCLVTLLVLTLVTILIVTAIF